MAFDGTKRSIPCAVLLFVAALSSAAPALADPNDGAFVDALAKGGIVLPDDNAAIAMAHTVCAGLDQRAKTSLLAMKLMKDTDLSMKQSGYFIGAAISAYCPQNAGNADNSTRYLYPGLPLM
ncbi:MAG TPA: DUF732 domain-containing protein [Mycobacterium sp.]|uniref:DUF732 domain-containing protein n=1 Tax=Mycobacterium sp. TaxID=1785 RepID=UPI002C3A6E8A|nr:DUF732 domain-containing protein [Mycobacterium sp.]HXO78876.1 DUF732 domain-containing protein [Mycobacterium sp.]